MVDGLVSTIGPDDNLKKLTDREDIDNDKIVEKPVRNKCNGLSYSSSTQTLSFPVNSPGYTDWLKSSIRHNQDGCGGREGAQQTNIESFKSALIQRLPLHYLTPVYHR